MILVHNCIDNLIDEGAPIYGSQHVQTNYSSCRGQLLSQSVCSSDLDRCHKEHVKLHVIIDQAFNEDQPLLSLIFKLVEMSKEIKNEEHNVEHEAQ